MTKQFHSCDKCKGKNGPYSKIKVTDLPLIDPNFLKWYDVKDPYNYTKFVYEQRQKAKRSVLVTSPKILSYLNTMEKRKNV